MRALLPIALLTLTGCENIEVQFTAPSKAGDYEAAESQANDHYEYVAMPKTYILVRPVEETAGKAGADTKGAAAATGAPAIGAANSKKDGSKDAAAKPDAAAGASSNAGASLASAMIDGKAWEAMTVQLPDDERHFVVKGVSGFWRSTTIGLSKRDNSELVTSVSSSAENLVPKRMQQVASVVGAVVQIGAQIAGVDSTKEGVKPLTSFVVEVPGRGQRSDGIFDTGWSYSFKYDVTEAPAGTVSYQDFIDKAMNRKVAYWPIPACRAATLTLGTDTKEVAVFHLVVSSSDVVRLQPLPIKGKVDFGSICGATASGTMTSDPLSVAADDLQALQQAIKTIQDAKGKKDGASSRNTNGAK